MDGHPVPLEVMKTRVAALTAVKRTVEPCGLRHAAMLPPGNSEGNSYFGASVFAGVCAEH